MTPIRRPLPHIEWGQIEQGQVPPGHAPAPTPPAPAPEPAPQQHHTRPWSLLVRDLAQTAALAVLLYGSVHAALQPFRVEGSSMEPSLHSGQLLLVNKLAYSQLRIGDATVEVPGLSHLAATLSSFGKPQRGDIVVFRAPRDKSEDYVKRIVALPGETVEIRRGAVLVNGQRIEEPYIATPAGYSRPAATLGPDEYFVLGDNRNNSSDSHVWGPVPGAEIIGKASWVK